MVKYMSCYTPTIIASFVTCEFSLLVDTIYNKIWHGINQQLLL